MKTFIKKITAFVAALLVLYTSAGFSVSAANVIPTDRIKPLLVDDADLLTQEEEDKLLAALESVSAAQACDVAVVTVNSLDGKSSSDYADDYFDYNGYGYGPEDSGILLLISMGEREWAISTYGDAIYAFSDERISDIEDHFVGSLSRGDYYAAFSRYATDCDSILSTYRSGGYETPEIIDSDEKKASEAGAVMGVGGIISAVAGLIVVGNQKRGMKNVKAVNNAAYYTKKDALRLSRERDVFLYRNVSRTRRESSSSGGSRSSSGSHSTVHHSSSGRSHGGSHGHF